MNRNDYVNKMLKMKKLNEKYIFFFKEITNFINETDKEIYEDLNKLYNDYNIFETNECIINKKSLAFKNKNLNFINFILNNKIKMACNHEFIEDSIDIAPDKSENITYCSLCEYIN